MVADDSKFIRDIHSELAIELGYDVIEAKTYDEIIKMAETEKPDLILLDLLIPGKGGLEVLK